MKTVEGKVPMELLVPEALEAWAWAMKEGADKYKPNDWREGNGMPWTWLIAAIQRHANLMMKGENFDTASPIPGMTHAAKIMASASMLVYYLEHHKQFNKDDRFQIGKPAAEQTPQCKRCNGDNVVYEAGPNGVSFKCIACDSSAHHPHSKAEALELWNNMKEREK